MQVVIKKFGSMNIVSIPEEIMNERNLDAGDELDVDLNQEGDIVFSPSKPQVSLESLLAASPQDQLSASEEDRAWEAMRSVGRED